MEAHTMKHYKAPWGTSLVVMSSVISVLCLGITIGTVWQGHGLHAWVGLLPFGIIVGSVLFTIRGYTITSDAILVHRLFWATRVPLAGLKSAQFKPDAMRRSIRTFGNGGSFSFAGWFCNRTLGSYRAFVTDPHRTVVLHYADRTVVVSPDEPEDFIRNLAITS